MNKLLLAFVLYFVCGSVWAQNTTCQTRPNGDSSNACASTAFVHNNVPATAKSFNASGSGQTTTGTTSGSTIALGAAIDFVNGQGIRVLGAGATYSLSAPTALAVTVCGANTEPGCAGGSTTYTYTISCLDAGNGVGASLTGVATATGPATITVHDAIVVSWNAATGCIGYAVWRKTGAGAYAFIAAVQGTSFTDAGLATITPPWWIPSTPLAVAQNDAYVGTITAGGGTTQLIVNPATTNVVSSVYVSHEDTAALAAYMAASPAATLPAGTYRISSLTLPATQLSISCPDGPGNTVILGSSTAPTANGPTIIYGTGLSAGFTVIGCAIEADNTAVSGLSIYLSSNVTIAHNRFGGFFGVVTSGDTRAILDSNSCDVWWQGCHLSIGDLFVTDIGNFAAFGAYGANGAPAFNATNTNGPIFTNNIVQGGSSFGIACLGTGSTMTAIGNQIQGTRHEGIITNCKNSIIEANWLLWFGSTGPATTNAASNDFCMSFSDNGNSVVENITVKGNTCISSGIAAITLPGTGNAPTPIRNMVIEGNHIITPNVTNPGGPSACGVLLYGSNVTNNLIIGNDVRDDSGLTTYNYCEWAGSGAGTPTANTFTNNFSYTNGTTANYNVVGTGSTQDAPLDAYTQTTPVPTAGAGAFTTVSSVVRSQSVGKTTSVSVAVTVTAFGTASASIQVAVPKLPKQFTACSAVDTSNGSITMVGQITTAGTVFLIPTAGAISNNTYLAQCTYETL